MDEAYKNELIKEIKNSGDKLDPEFKAKWVEALRSGGYKKGVTKLYNPKNNSYCCLGVAAHLCGAKFDDDGDTDFKAYGGDGFDINVKSAFGLGWVATHALYRLNDSVFVRFEPIADIIEEHL